MSIKKSHELKEIQSRKKKLEVECNELLEDSRKANRKYEESKHNLSLIDKRIKDIENENEDVIVTEHAILRYLERRYELNLNDIKKEILSEQNENAIKAFGSGTYQIGDGFKAVVKGKTVVSVI